MKKITEKPDKQTKTQDENFCEMIAKKSKNCKSIHKF